MLPTATIVFREFLEIALVVSVVMAATHGLTGRWKLILAGFGLGALGSALIGLSADQISNALGGMGQELFDAGIMFAAVGFLSWTILWMKKHGRELSRQLHQVGSDVVAGTRPKTVIISVIALASLREGAEIVLFTYGMVASEAFSLSSIVAGAVLGAVGGTLVGAMLYLGVLKTARRHLLTVTGWLLILLTAGMAAQGAGLLVAADVLPAISPQLWDTSHLIAGHSLIGELLGVLMGYTPRPSGMEVAFFAVVLLTIGTCYHHSATHNGRRARAHAQTS
jgi:high-affinity iron transporter